MLIHTIVFSALAAAGIHASPQVQKMSFKAAVREVVAAGGAGSSCPGDWAACNGNLVCQLGVCVDPSTKPQQPTPPPPTTDWQPQVLAVHNNHRRVHGAPDLQWSDFLAQKAQTVANACITPDGTNNNPIYPYGYNGGYGTPWFGGDQLTPSSAVSSAEGWYASVKYYNWNNPGWQQRAGTFTQLVWKSTQYLGCAVAIGSATQPRCNNYDWYLVCLYSPAGNVDSPGYFRQNVLPAGTAVTADDPSIPASTPSS